MENQFIFIDFEFTTFDRNEAPKGFFHEVIEIGMAAVRENTIVNTYSSLVAPVFFPELGEKCMSLTGISQNDVMNGIEFNQMIDVLLAWYIPGETTLVTWGDLDIKGLRRNCREHKIKFPFSVMLDDWLDLSKAYQAHHGHKNTPGLWYALQTYELTETVQSHRALEDALATYKVLQRMLEDQWVYAPSQKASMQTSIADLMGHSDLLLKLKEQLT